MDSDAMDINEYLLLPEMVLNAQTCKECLNYLSVGPIMTTKNDAICGRCVNKQMKPENLKMSLYNKIAEGCVFSCVNRYDGCNAMLTFSETRNHESDCTGAEYACPICSFFGNGCQFVQHCKQEHTENILEEGVFKIDTNSADLEDNLIYFDVDHIVIVNRSITFGVLKISSKLLNISNARSKLNKYNLRFFKTDTKVEFVSGLIEFQLEVDKTSEKCFEVDVSELVKIFCSSTVYCVFILNHDLVARDYNMRQTYITIENDIRKEKYKISGENNKIMLLKQLAIAPYNVLKELINIFHEFTFNCRNCNVAIKDKFDIFACPQSHICCANCLNRYCNTCQSDCDWTNIKLIFRDLEFACDWKNCETKSKIHEYLLHKQICKLRQYKCPLEHCVFIGTKEELVTHWHSETIPLKIGKTVDFETKTSCEIYWLIDYFCELLQVRIIKTNNSTVWLDIKEDAVSPHNYNIELRYLSNNKRYEHVGILVQVGKIKKFNGNIVNCHTCRLIVNSK